MSELAQSNGAQNAPRLGAPGSTPATQSRPYQLAADAAITHELEVRGLRSTLLVAATGSGKTVMYCARVARAKLRGQRTLILAHRDELIRQPRRKIETLGIHADVEKGKERASLMRRS